MAVKENTMRNADNFIYSPIYGILANVSMLIAVYIAATGGK